MKPAPFDTLKLVETLMAEFDIPEANAKTACVLLRDLLSPETSQTRDVGEQDDVPLRPSTDEEDVCGSGSMVGNHMEKIPPGTGPHGPMGEGDLSGQNSKVAFPVGEEMMEETPSDDEFPRDDTQDDFLGLCPVQCGAPTPSSSRFPPADDIRLTVNISRRHHRKIKLEALLSDTTIGEMVEGWIDKEIP